MVAANKIDVDAGKIAKSHSKNNAKCKQFAAADDHRPHRDEQAGFRPRQEAEREARRERHQQEPEEARRSRTEASLKKLKGAEFDKAYVNHEVDYHQQVLDAIDKVLIPNAKNAELKGLIEKVRPAIATHLEHAKHLQASLK